MEKPSFKKSTDAQFDALLGNKKLSVDNREKLTNLAIENKKGNPEAVLSAVVDTYASGRKVDAIKDDEFTKGIDELIISMRKSNLKDFDELKANAEKHKNVWEKFKNLLKEFINKILKKEKLTSRQSKKVIGKFTSKLQRETQQQQQRR